MPLSSSAWSGAREPAEHIIRPTGELTAATTPALRRSIARRLSQGIRRIVVDLSDVEAVDSSGREALAICAHVAHAANAELVVTPPLVRAPLRLA